MFRVGTYVIQWSSEGTQYAFLENMSRVLGYVCLLSNCPFVHPSVYLANLFRIAIVLY